MPYQQVVKMIFTQILQAIDKALYSVERTDEKELLLISEISHKSSMKPKLLQFPAQPLLRHPPAYVRRAQAAKLQRAAATQELSNPFSCLSPEELLLPLQKQWQHGPTEMRKSQ